LRTKLDQYQKWDDKLDAAIDILLNDASNARPTRQDVAMAIHAFYAFLQASSLYESRAIFHGNIMLVKPSRPHAMMRQLPEDYGLSECCNGTIEVSVLEGQHEDFLRGQGAQQCAGIINRLLQRCLLLSETSS
ncbi:hypothetical protein MTO96_045210, partial [Rhipicephalus appendiculatus]